MLFADIGLSYAQKDSWDIDYQATLNMLNAARQHKAAHFVLLSAICVQKPLLEFQHAKLKFEAALQAAGDITYSIVRPTAFFKSLAGQASPAALCIGHANEFADVEKFLAGQARQAFMCICYAHCFANQMFCHRNNAPSSSRSPAICLPESSCYMCAWCSLHTFVFR